MFDREKENVLALKEKKNQLGSLIIQLINKIWDVKAKIQQMFVPMLVARSNKVLVQTLFSDSSKDIFKGMLSTGCFCECHLLWGEVLYIPLSDYIDDVYILCFNIIHIQSCVNFDSLHDLP